uniref:Uncharacterized protein n=1 Tax=Cacopsylla melanoneura TaxID=428564 RepID=A0A8D8Y084_9HEMI
MANFMSLILLKLDLFSLKTRYGRLMSFFRFPRRMQLLTSTRSPRTSSPKVFLFKPTLTFSLTEFTSSARRSIFTFKCITFVKRSTGFIFIKTCGKVSIGNTSSSFAKVCFSTVETSSFVKVRKGRFVSIIVDDNFLSFPVDVFWL